MYMAANSIIICAAFVSPMETIHFWHCISKIVFMSTLHFGPVYQSELWWSMGYFSWWSGAGLEAYNMQHVKIDKWSHLIDKLYTHFNSNALHKWYPYNRQVIFDSLPSRIYNKAEKLEQSRSVVGRGTYSHQVCSIGHAPLYHGNF